MLGPAGSSEGSSKGKTQHTFTFEVINVLRTDAEEAKEGEDKEN